MLVLTILDNEINMAVLLMSNHADNVVCEPLWFFLFSLKYQSGLRKTEVIHSGT